MFQSLAVEKCSVPCKTPFSVDQGGMDHLQTLHVHWDHLGDPVSDRVPNAASALEALERLLQVRRAGRGLARKRLGCTSLQAVCSSCAKVRVTVLQFHVHLMS